MQKFAASITQTMQHIEGEVRLDVPDVEWKSDDPDVNVRNDQLRQKVEDTCRNWHKQISAALEVLQKKTPQVCGLLPPTRPAAAAEGRGTAPHRCSQDFLCELVFLNLF